MKKNYESNSLIKLFNYFIYFVFGMMCKGFCLNCKFCSVIFV